MSGRWKKRLLVAVSVLVLLIAVLVLGLQAWLAGGIGKGLIESRLSSALGRPVRLDGEFELRLLPRPGISGTSLKIFTRDARWLLVDASQYTARVSLGPLLDGEVEVVALEIDTAAIDAGRLVSEPSVAREPGADYFQIPDIHALDLAQVSVFFDGMNSEPFLRVVELSVEGFRIDEPSAFETSVSLVSDGVDQVLIDANGLLTLRSAGIAEVTLSRLDAQLPGWGVREIEGGLSINFIPSMAGIGLEWRDSEQSFRFGAKLNWNPDSEGAGTVYALEDIEMGLDGWLMTGSGCLLPASRPQLNLVLSSENLDLDAFSLLLKKWQLPDSAPGVSQLASASDGSAASGEGDSLPFDLALGLEVGEAIYEGARAEGVRLSIGLQPACPDGAIVP